MAFRIIRHDITKVRADAIVNTADVLPCIGYGTDKAINDAAGPALIEEREERIGVIEPGEARSTKAYGLPAKYVIHAVAPVWMGGHDDELNVLRETYDSALKEALRLGCETVAFPLLAAGNLGFPKDKALKTAIDAFTDFLLFHEMDITLVVFDERAFRLSESITSSVESFIDSHYIEEVKRSEFDLSPSATIEEIRDAENNEADLMYRLSEPMELKDEDDEEITTTVLYQTAWEDEEEEDEEREKEVRRWKRETVVTDLIDVPPHIEKRAEEIVLDEIKRGFPISWAEAVEYAEAEYRKENGKEDLGDMLKSLDEGFADTLRALINASGEKPSAIYGRANIDRKLYSKIMTKSDYRPSKMTAIAFALALRLDLDGTQDLIGRAGYTLTSSSKFDVIIEWAIKNRLYNIIEINTILFNYDQSLIGGREQ